MQKVTVALENCYGIGKFNHEFDFSRSNIFSIYAPNGFMKTSLANTFQDVMDQNISSDLIFPERTTTRLIQDETYRDLLHDEIFVIESYDEKYAAQNISLLLVNKDLKEKYDIALSELKNIKNELEKELKEVSGIKKSRVDLDDLLLKTFKSKSIWDCYQTIEKSVASSAKLEELNIPYYKHFTDRVLTVLKQKDFLEKIDSYVQSYNDLINKSALLTEDFTHVDANAINKQLSSSGFFEAEHQVSLRTTAEGKYETISDGDELKAKFNEEYDKILADDTLKKSFEKLDGMLIKNADLQSFREFLKEHPKLTPFLADTDSLFQRFWIEYFRTNIDLLKKLTATYAHNSKIIEEVTNEAKHQKTTWENVLTIFKKRFLVPFEMDIINQEEVILKEKAPQLQFTFREGSKSVTKERNDLTQILSRGERRALYLLQVIFELEVIKAKTKDCLIIVDDIADSFDYKNKYAIIQYLEDVAKQNNFKLIFLTHNFDFHRTVSSRLIPTRTHRLHVSKSGRIIELLEEKYQKNPLNHWKCNLNQLPFFLSAIPLARNLVEYTSFSTTQNAVFNTLTSFLHVKATTATLTLEDLKNQYQDVFDGLRHYAPDIDLSQNYLRMLETEADNLVQAQANHAELESKIILSIVIRLVAEQIMIHAINDQAFVDSITKFQTRKLFERVCVNNLFMPEQVDLLEQVNLMTPENIHLNSFMIEPILDMDPHHLKDLYCELKKLKANQQAVQPAQAAR